MHTPWMTVMLPLFLAGACSSSPSHPDVGAAETADGSPGSGAASCETVVQGVIDVCTSRHCEHLQFKTLCQTGNPAAVAGIFRCFGRNMCWIPGDENSAGRCIDAAIRAADPQADAIAARLCALCPGDAGGCVPLSSYGLGPWYLSQTLGDALRNCVFGATTCGAANQCSKDALTAAGFQWNPC
jgi:hypothetical protein